MTKRKIQYWVIPPESDSEFVAAMEDVLDIYALLYRPSSLIASKSRGVSLFFSQAFQNGRG